RPAARQDRRSSRADRGLWGVRGMSATDMEFQQLSERVDRAEAALRDLPDDARAKAMDLKAAVDAFHGHALRQLIRLFGEEIGGREMLCPALEDPSAHAVCTMHGIIQLPVESRGEATLAEVRPYVNSHGDDVELVRADGDTAYVRLMGACSGCYLAAATL